MSNLFDFDSDSTVPVAELFHENSKLPSRVPDTDGSPFGPGPATGGWGNVKLKTYRTGVKTALPPRAPLGHHVCDLLDHRRSVREYRDDPVTLWQLGQLLGWSHGISGRPGDSRPTRRPAPSAGALYPIEIYVAVQRVTGLERGVYHYNATTHTLESTAPGSALAAIHRACLYPDIVTQASLYLMMAAMFARTCQKYGERGYRFVLLDCGHVAQNLHLVGAAVGLGSVGIGGFLDDPLNDVLELDGVNEAVVHTMALGPQ